MKEFFLNMNTSGFKFYVFGSLYVISLILVIIFLMLIIYKKNKIASIRTTTKGIIRFTFGLLLILCYVLRRGSYLYYGVYDWRNNLSLGFCNMNNILFIIYCLSGNKKIFNFCYYCTFCGPLLSILMPVINIEINNFSFVNFIIIHHVIFLMNIVFAIFESKSYCLQHMIYAGAYMVIYLLSTYFFNFLFNTNYNFVKQFLIEGLLNNSFIELIINNRIFNFVILVSIGFIMILIGGLFLKILNSKGRTIKNI